MDHGMKRGKVETGASDSVRGEEEQIRELILRETLLHSTIVDDQSLCALSRQSCERITNKKKKKKKKKNFRRGDKRKCTSVAEIERTAQHNDNNTSVPTMINTARICHRPLFYLSVYP
ncbi:hypothetical protein T4E_904 [Trichinella pseudospiralis]|uniref:Uncharacterized protein n=1 Tax=Trichinella pseudospiralis TaxID=6337 RepID=A0A0V0YDA8_TRIPS|nr:hypothetical protein T4E_904 [Trichinella pseudospiralis]